MDRNKTLVRFVPDIQCPHCFVKFTATWFDLSQGEEMPCVGCDGIIHILHLEDPGEGHVGDISVIFSTNPERKRK